MLPQISTYIDLYLKVKDKRSLKIFFFHYLHLPLRSTWQFCLFVSPTKLCTWVYIECGFYPTSSSILTLLPKDKPELCFWKKIISGNIMEVEVYLPSSQNE